MSKGWVLDASALLALLGGEKGAETAADAIERGAVMSAVNAAEVYGKLHGAGFSDVETEEMVGSLGIEIVDFNYAQACRTGQLAGMTQSKGLSLGDRACLALAEQLGFTALTADKAWTELELRVKVQLVR